MTFLNAYSTLRWSMTVLMYTALALPLISCGEASGTKSATLDLAAEPMPFSKPEFEAQIALPGVAVLPAVTQQVLTLRRAFFAGDFAMLEMAMMKSHNDYLAGIGGNTVANWLIADIQDTELAGIDSCAAWLRAMPTSYPAHWLCGAMWRHAASSARGTKFANEVNDARFAIMRERLQRASALLERATTLAPKPIEALTILGDGYYLSGDDKKAVAFLQRAERVMPQHWRIYDTRLNYALPQWGGSIEQVGAVFEQAKQAGVDADRLLDLYDKYIARPGLLSTPGAPRAYWERVIREHPTRQRLKGLLNNFVLLENWLEALPIASRLIAEYPDDESAYYSRATIHERLGRLAEARADYYTAAAMGKNLALQELIMAHIRGGLGITEKSFDNVLALCRYGAALGTGVGTNCIGSLFFEGGSKDVPHRNDASQGLAWHLMGARAGHYNSQYDLGWMLFSGQVGAMKGEAAKRQGIFWLRRAAEQDHIFAKRKLEEHGISPSENTQSLVTEGFGGESIVATVRTVLSKIF